MFQRQTEQLALNKGLNYRGRKARNQVRLNSTQRRNAAPMEGRKERQRTGTGAAESPMQNAKLYSLLFIIFNSSKVFTSRFDKNEKYRSTLLSVGETGYMYSYGEILLPPLHTKKK